MCARVLLRGAGLLHVGSDESTLSLVAKCPADVEHLRVCLRTSLHSGESARSTAGHPARQTGTDPLPCQVDESATLLAERRPVIPGFVLPSAAAVHCPAPRPGRRRRHATRPCHRPRRRQRHQREADEVFVQGGRRQVDDAARLDRQVCHLRTRVGRRYDQRYGLLSSTIGGDSARRAVRRLPAS